MTTRSRILIVDCHEDSLIALEQLLENAGFDATTAWTVQDALRLLDAKAFSLVLINEYLCEGPAEQVLRALRRRGIGTPCILMYPSSPVMLDAKTCRPLGIVGVVCKHQHDDLLEEVRGFFHHSHTPEALRASA